nr:MAG TPA: replication protein P [Caudoviricetes sp.]
MNVGIRQENCVSGVDLNTHVSELVNQLFNRLCVYCNRWRYNYPTDEALEEAKFIWIEELVNHDVLSVDMLERGLAIVRAARSDYFPNLFDFIEWCKIPMDLPSEEELAQRLASFQCYGMADVDKFKFNSTVEYWLITDLYCRCRRYTWSVEQLRKEIKQALRNMGDRLKNGEVLPEPTKQLLPQATSMPVSKTRQAEIIASIKGSLRGH